MSVCAPLGMVLFALLAVPSPCPAEAEGFFRSGPPRLAPGAPVTPGDHERRLFHGGLDRWYELHVPPAVRAGKPLPVVLDFHGGGGHPEAARRGTRMDGRSDAVGFLVVYPAGTGPFPRRLLTFNAGDCCGRAQKDGVDDVGFVRAILDDLPKLLAIDPDRVYATGFSNGGMISHRLGCELSDRLAAIAAVSGPLGVASCTPTRPIPVMHIHGTADQNAPYAGGIGHNGISGTDFRSVDETIALWRSANRSKGPPIVERVGPRTKQIWKGSADVILITIEGQGHRWPGGAPLLPERMVGADVGGFDASREIWSFFEKHARGGR